MKARTLILTLAAIAAFAAPAAYAATDDASTVLRYLGPKAGKYQLEFTNTSGVGYINALRWVAPSGLTLTGITGTSGGTCRLDADVIACKAGARNGGIPPPKCTCLPGGSLTVNFTARGYAPTFNGQYWTFHGFVGDTVITSMTPVPYHIPSYAGGDEPDLPLCDPGTQATEAHPCYVE